MPPEHYHRGIVLMVPIRTVYFVCLVTPWMPFDSRWKCVFKGWHSFFRHYRLPVRPRYANRVRRFHGGNASFDDTFTLISVRCRFENNIVPLQTGCRIYLTRKSSFTGRERTSVFLYTNFHLFQLIMRVQTVGRPYRCTIYTCSGNI